jgi:hypothetical protein
MFEISAIDQIDTIGKILQIVAQSTIGTIREKCTMGQSGRIGTRGSIAVIDPTESSVEG